jgi:formyl-CoA transferase
MPFSRVMYLTADDRWLQFTMVRTHEEFIDFLAALGASSLLQDARFATPPERLVHGAELIAELRPRLLGETSRVWMARFREAGVPASLVSVLDDLLEDPQLEANGIVAAPVEDVGTDRVITPPINVAGLAKVGIKKAPELGEHNQEILGGLGYDADAIQALADERVI